MSNIEKEAQIQEYLSLFPFYFSLLNHLLVRESSNLGYLYPFCQIFYV